MRLFDTHAHLDDEQLAGILPDVLQRARSAGVVAMIAVGTTADSSRACVALSQGQPDVFAAVGIQPNYCGQATDEDWDEVVRLAAQPKVVALGETGLDRYWDYSPFDRQQEFFARHVQLSQQTGLPFIVHMRDCGSDIVDQLRAARRGGPLAGVMHSFTGDERLAEDCLDLGLYISFAGMVSFKKSAELRRVAAGIPADRLLLETDSPYLSPHPLRGRRPNEPALLVHTARSVAEARGVAVEELAELATENAYRLFSRAISPSL